MMALKKADVQIDILSLSHMQVTDFSINQQLTVGAVL